MILYSFWRSTTSYRARIALNLIGLDYEIRPVDLVAGAQKEPGYAALNPGKSVPTLVLDDGTILTQSLAIMDYLHSEHPESGLLPVDPVDRAKVLAAAHTVAMDIHPINNLRVLGELKKLGHDQDETVRWMHHWMHEGFAAYQSLIKENTLFSFGDQPDMADICLTAQMYNARRWGLDLAPYSRLVEIEQRCLELEAFQKAYPDNQPDARV